MNKDKKIPIASVSNNRNQIKNHIKKLTKWARKSNSLDERLMLLKLISFYQDHLKF